MNVVTKAVEKMEPLFRAIMLGVLPFIAVACGDVKLKQFNGSGGGISGDCAEYANLGPSVSAFSCTLYPRLMAPTSQKGYGCYACHANAGSQAPQYLYWDPTETHDALIESNKVNLQKPELSALINKMKQSHNCNENCDQWAKEMLTAINQWNSLRGASVTDVGPSIVNWKTGQTQINNLKVPGIQLSDPDYPSNQSKPVTQLISFDISSRVGAAGATLEVTVERISRFGWIMYTPILRASKAVRVKSMALLLNDLNLPANSTWRNLDVKIAANSTTPFSSSTLVFDQLEDVSEHKVALGFEVLEETTITSTGGGSPVAAGKTAAQRLAEVNGMITNKCIGCHANGNGTGITLTNLQNGNEAAWTNQAMKAATSFAGGTFAIAGANAANSVVYRVIRGVGLPAGQQPMPTANVAQATRDADAAIILEFLQKIGQP